MKINKELSKNITKGLIADYAKNIAHLNHLNEEELAEIFIEIAKLLKITQKIDSCPVCMHKKCSCANAQATPILAEVITYN